MLDSDLAKLYDVETKVLNQAVKGNIARFPEDFMFQLNKEESSELSRSQFVTLKRGQNIKYLPHAFTGHSLSLSQLQSNPSFKSGNKLKYLSYFPAFGLKLNSSAKSLYVLGVIVPLLLKIL